LALAAALCASAPVQASSVDFAHFNLATCTSATVTRTQDTDTYSWATSADVTFNFVTSSTGLSSANHTATLTLTGTLNGSSTGSPNFDQPLGTTGTLASMVFTEVGTGKDLLTVSFTGHITGALGGNVGQFVASTLTAQGNPDTVKYHSDFLQFGSFDSGSGGTNPGITGASFLIGLPNVSPAFTSKGGVLNIFSWNADGVAGSNGFFVNSDVSDPFALTPVPGPASVVMLGWGLGATGLIAVRRVWKSKLRPKPAPTSIEAG
jgi:hypothetical protein